uniref:Zinc finger DHHC-type palmitoyltransferase 4 n=1 Tax=Cairina moschata TaxID=8855 RepID=A0A8C3C2U0_CAIMO
MCRWLKGKLHSCQRATCCMKVNFVVSCKIGCFKICSRNYLNALPLGEAAPVCQALEGRSPFCCRSHLFTVLHVALEVAVYAEYTWEVFPYCWELEFHLLLLLLPYLLLAGNIGCFVLCSRADPGIITKSNHASVMKIYAYDGALFQKGIRCPTCDMEKPARSKHCHCDLCVWQFCSASALMIFLIK